MTEPEPPPLLSARYRKVRHEACTEVRKLVKFEEDEVTKLRRRLHIHLTLIGLAGFLTFMSLFSFLDAYAVVSSSVCIQVLQEYVDYAGRF
jgi:hypothetical protein